MVWGAISIFGCTKLAFLEGTVNAEIYQKVLQKYLLPMVKKVNFPWSFQHDGAIARLPGQSSNG
jgi:hypothetical protein